MTQEGAGTGRLQVLACCLTAVNAVLALNFIVIVPFLGWLNYGRANWATTWMPDVFLTQVLPGSYHIYWHYWFVILVPAFFTSCFLYRRTQRRGVMSLIVLNALTMVAFWVVRIALVLLDIHPDIV